MEFEINKRLQLFIDDLGITPYAFSKKMGNKRAETLYKILDNKVSPSAKTLEKIKDNFPELNYSWLLTGEGSMKKGAAPKEPVANDEQDEYRPHDLNSVHLDLKKDIRELAKGMQENFKVVNDGMVRQLMKQQKILDFVESLNAKEIASATSDLKKLLEQKK